MISNMSGCMKSKHALNPAHASAAFSFLFFYIFFIFFFKLISLCKDRLLEVFKDRISSAETFFYFSTHSGTLFKDWVSKPTFDEGINARIEKNVLWANLNIPSEIEWLFISSSLMRSPQITLKILQKVKLEDVTMLFTERLSQIIASGCWAFAQTRVGTLGWRVGGGFPFLPLVPIVRLASSGCLGYCIPCGWSARCCYANERISKPRAAAAASQVSVRVCMCVCVSVSFPCDTTGSLNGQGS